MSDIIRLRRVSWKSKNNVYLLNGENLEDILTHWNIKINLLILPYSFLMKKNEIDIIYYWLQWKDILLRKNLIDISEAQTISENICLIDGIQVWNYTWAWAVIAMNIDNEKYYWQNIWIITS